MCVTTSISALKSTPRSLRSLPPYQGGGKSRTLEKQGQTTFYGAQATFIRALSSG